jgi:hypothetical protein
LPVPKKNPNPKKQYKLHKQGTLQSTMTKHKVVLHVVLLVELKEKIHIHSPTHQAHLKMLEAMSPLHILMDMDSH